MQDKNAIQLIKEAQTEISELIIRDKPTGVFFSNDQILQDKFGDFYIPDVTVHIAGFTFIGNLYISLGNKPDAIFNIALTMARATRDIDKWTRWAKDMGYEHFYIPPEIL